MINNTIKNGIKRIEKNSYSGRENIMKTIKNTYLKCINFGHKKKWIIPVQFGVSMVADAGIRILTSIKNTVSGGSTDNV
tara:strand:+ start:804 stop:1040 length:237 start_codon:yes stop_codon:yes gene_type:complete